MMGLTELNQEAGDAEEKDVASGDGSLDSLIYSHRRNYIHSQQNSRVTSRSIVCH